MMDFNMLSQKQKYQLYSYYGILYDEKLIEKINNILKEKTSSNNSNDPNDFFFKKNLILSEKQHDMTK